MAKTNGSYRLGARAKRTPQQLSTMSSGIYLTEQAIPQGYAKMMVNWDIDITGSNIRNRNGRELIQTVVDPTDIHYYGPDHIVDYIYTYKQGIDEVEDLKDMVISFGKFGDVNDFVDSTLTYNGTKCFVSKVIKHDITSEVQEDIVTSNLWGLYCDQGEEQLNYIDNTDVGAVSARIITNAYAYDKKINQDLSKPIFTVLNNEVYAFTSANIEYNYNASDASQTSWVNEPSFDLTKLIIRKREDNTYGMSRKVMVPRELSVSEVVNSGYNILHDSPYVFRNTEGSTAKANASILYKTEDADKPILNPTVGSDYALRIYYQYLNEGDTLYYKIEHKELSSLSSYEQVCDWTEFSAGDILNIPYTIIWSQTSLKIYFRTGTDDSTIQLTPQVIDTNLSKGDVEPKEFNLKSARGMTSWQGCLGLYGVDDAKDTIFFSDIEDPSYFPYPNNAITLDNEILAVHKYLDYLLVITVDSVWLLKSGATFAETVTKRILTNVFIPEIDAMNAITMKDQIFFKTDTQFYVLKPNNYTSDATDLKNFTNSVAISNFTINFTREVLDVLNKTYRTITEAKSELERKRVYFDSFKVIDTRSNVRDSDIHYVYTIIPYIEETSYGKLDLHLVYDSVTRSYRIHLVGCGHDSFELSPLLYRNKQSGVFYEIIPHNAEQSKILICKSSQETVSDDIVIDGDHLVPYLNNYQFLDTGNVALEDVHLKRFRELQFNILNKEVTAIDFYTDFKVDGQTQVSTTKYSVTHITDPADPDYGKIIVLPESNTNMQADSQTVLAESTLESQYWSVDLSNFPESTVATVRLQVLGKGRRGSLELLTTSLKRLQLSTIVWVFRSMSAR